MRFRLRAGLTEPLVFSCLQADPGTGEISAVALYQMLGAELHLRRRDTGALSSFATAGPLPGPQLAITDAADGEVTYYPAEGDLAEGEYDCWLEITDGTFKTTSFPSDQNGLLKVIGAF